jgi:hypothetical protein
MIGLTLFVLVLLVVLLGGTQTTSRMTSEMKRIWMGGDE